MYHHLLQKSKRRKLQRCKFYSICVFQLPLLPPAAIMQESLQHPFPLSLQESLLLLFLYYWRAAIGEQKRLKSKKVLSDKKAFRRSRNSWD